MTVAFATLPDIPLSIDIKVKSKSGENWEKLVQNNKTIALGFLIDIAHSIDIK